MHITPLENSGFILLTLWALSGFTNKTMGTYCGLPHTNTEDQLCRWIPNYTRMNQPSILQIQGLSSHSNSNQTKPWFMKTAGHSSWFFPNFGHQIQTHLLLYNQPTFTSSSSSQHNYLDLQRDFLYPFTTQNHLFLLLIVVWVSEKEN